MSAIVTPIVTAATVAVAEQTQHPYVALYAETNGWDILYLDEVGLAEERAAGRVVLSAADLGLTEAALDEVAEASADFYNFNNSVAYMDDYMQARSDALEIAMERAEAVVWTAVNAYLAAAAVAAVVPAESEDESVPVPAATAVGVPAESEDESAPVPAPSVTG
jgi:hypothetical protein